jgi:DNA repair protein RadD
MDWYQEIIGADVLKVLQAFSKNKLTIATVKEIFNTLYTHEDIFINKNLRNQFFQLLRETEAKSLELKFKKNLDSLSVGKGSSNYKNLCEFFFLRYELLKEDEFERLTNTVIPKYYLFDHQINAVNSVKNKLKLSGKKVLMHMPTGSGKTRMGMNIVADYFINTKNKIVVWIANSEELCTQATEEFEKAWSYLGNRELKIHRYWGTHTVNFDEVQEGFFVVGFSKLNSKIKQDITALAKIGSKTALLVVDEAHQAVAPTYELIIKGLCSGQYELPLLGLTATPGRTWNNVDADKKLSTFFNRQKVGLHIDGYQNPIDFLVEKNFLARPMFRTLASTGIAISEKEIEEISDSLDIPIKILNKLAADEARTIQIINEIKNLLNRHQRIIVFATTVEHAQKIVAILIAVNISAKCVVGTTSQDARAKNISWFKEVCEEKRVIVNYGVLTTGFDAPKTSAVLITRPTKSLVLYSQMVGRAIRGKLAGGNEEAEIVTVVDTTLPGFGNLAEAFKNWEDVWE